MSTPPHSMPFYWWRYVNPNCSQTYDQSYDEQMFDMLPEWIKCIIIDKVRNISINCDTSVGSGTHNTSLLHNYTKAVNKVQTTKKVVDAASQAPKPSATHDGDMILHTSSTSTSHGISFTTCGGYKEVEVSHALKSSYRIAVPHLARLAVFHHQWATLPIPGRIVSIVYVLASYSNSTLGFRDAALDNKHNSISEVDDDLERPSVTDR